MTIFYSQKSYNFDEFYNGTLPVVKTVEGCDEINRWIRRGNHYPIIRLPYFFLCCEPELIVYQHTETLEVKKVYVDQPVPEDKKYIPILRGNVPRRILEPVPQAYMVPLNVKDGVEIFIPKIIKDREGINYFHHHGGVHAKFTGTDLTFLDKPNGIKVYR